jgi:hypothetical protein
MRSTLNVSGAWSYSAWREDGCEKGRRAWPVLLSMLLTIFFMHPIAR